jgi:putative ABC transport system ATP-binding protein
MLLQIKNVTKSFPVESGSLPVLRGISFDLAAGEMLALTGESGSGKSTLLHLAAGLEKPDSGDVLINEKSIAGMGDVERAALRRNSVGIIFQQFNLVPSLNVLHNLTLHARLASREDPSWTHALVNRLGLESHLGRYPEQLSGGQQQRVAIGRTLAARPDLILADEPTGNLDEPTGDAVMSLLLDLVARSGAALLMVTHSPRLAGMLDARVVLRAGRIA